MREKLKGFYGPRNKSAYPDTIVNKFRSEARSLVGESQLPMPFDYYVEIFKTAFEYIKQNPDK
jgi:hypothetical protein